MANFLKSLFIKGVEIDTAGASTGNVLSYNGTKFAPAAPGSGSLALDDLSDVVVTSPEEFQGLSYNGTSWVNSHIPLVSYVRNAESTTITTGTCVYLFGSTGDHATVKRADNNSDATSSKTIGVAGADITASNNGPIITRGYVDGVDLSTGYTAGDVLWLGENGAFTKTKPTAPDHLVFIGVVVRATNNGIIYVATQNGYEISELHDVKTNGKAIGDVLMWDGSVWVNNPIDLGTDTTGNYMSGISGTSPVSVAHTPSEGSSATVSLASGYGDTQNPYGSKTANTFLAAPNGSNGVPSFRAIAVADVPTLNQNTTGTASNITASSNTTLTSLSNLVTVGTITSGTWSGSFGSVSGANLTSLNASNLGSGTVPSARISGSYTGITAVGTLTAGSIPATLLTGTVDTARISGSYTGITAVGTLASLTVDGLSSTSITLGDWGGNGAYSSIGGLRGYLLFGATSDNNIYLRSNNNNNVYIGANDQNTLHVTSSQTLIGAGSVTTPSLALQGDTNTGFYSGTADWLLLACGGTSMATFTTSGPFFGTNTTTSSTTWRVDTFNRLGTPSSTRELKENIKDLAGEQALSIVRALRPRTFTWKPQPDDGEFLSSLKQGAVQAGFIVEEIEETTLPFSMLEYKPNISDNMTEDEKVEAATNLASYIPYYWKESHLIAILASAVKSLDARLAVLESTQ
jgi:hypothetical protein